MMLTNYFYIQGAACVNVNVLGFEILFTYVFKIADITCCDFKHKGI